MNRIPIGRDEEGNTIFADETRPTLPYEDYRIEIPPNPPSRHTIRIVIILLVLVAGGILLRDCFKQKFEPDIETFTDKFVYSNGLNVRTGPSADSNIVFILPRNVTVKVSDRYILDGWVKIEYSNTEGFVNRRYLSNIQTSTTKRFVNSNALNVREGPSTDFSIKFTLLRNAIVSVSDGGNFGDWVKIKYSTNEGFANRKYLANSRIIETQTLNTLSFTQSLPLISPQLSPKVLAVVSDMVFVRGGRFTMGCTEEQGRDCYRDENPAHIVTLSNYYIGRYEVTQELWRMIMGMNPSFFTGDDRLPVENISWNDIQWFIVRLNKLTGRNFRLPTEAEWEYAARGGMSSRHYKYSGSDDVDDVAWHKDNSGDKTYPVGTKLSNELGIHDMSGNVWEWVNDWSDVYGSFHQANPMGPASGIDRVYRGGGWNGETQYCRVSDRYSIIPTHRVNSIGFRLVLDP